MAHSWHRAVGGERYAASMQHAAERKALLEEARQGIRQLLLAVDPSPTRPVLSREDGVTRFAEAVEAVLRHGLLPLHKNSSSSSAWGGEEEEISLWAPVQEVLQRKWALEMRGLVHVRTDDGRTRALLRAALNGKYLDHLLRAILSVAPKWYAEHALLRQTEEAEVLVGLLGGLTGVDFALDVDVPHLDVTNGLKSDHDATLPAQNKKKKGARRARRVVAIDLDDGQRPSTPSSDSTGVTFTQLAPSEVLALTLLEELESVGDGDHRNGIADHAPSTTTTATNSSSVADDTMMDSGTRARHEMDMEALLASLQNDVDDDDDDDDDDDNDDGFTKPKSPPTTTYVHPPVASALRESEHPPMKTHNNEHAGKQHEHAWVRSASEGVIKITGDGSMVGEKEREIEELQRKLRELEDRLSSGSGGGSADLFLPSLLPPSFLSSSQAASPSSPFPLSSPSTEASPTPYSDAPSPPTHERQLNYHAPTKDSSSPIPASIYADHRPLRPAEDVNVTTHPDLPVDSISGEQRHQQRYRDETSGNAIILPPDRRDLFAASLFLSTTGLASAANLSSSTSSLSTSQRRGRTGSALSPSPTSSLSSSSSLATHSPSSPSLLSASALAPEPSAPRYAETSDSEDSTSSVGAGKRRQVFFHLHKRGTAADQHYLCAGCSAKMASWLLGGAGRYCEYTGRYYCYECHVNEAAIIPARVLREWDFRPYRVCHAAKTLLDQLYYLPAFAILDVNPRLYATAPSLYDVRALREQLSYMKEFIVTCREKDRLVPLAAGRLDLINADEMYSMHDLVETQSGRLAAFLSELSDGWLQHIVRCELCRGKGSICEVCNSERPIYPFQMRTTTKCDRCHALFHRACFDPQRCPKCARLTARRLAQKSSRSLASSPASASPLMSRPPPSSSSSSSSWSSFPSSSASASAWSSATPPEQRRKHDRSHAS